MMGTKRQSQPVNGSGAMSYTLVPNKEFVFEEVRIHLSAASATSEDFTITLSSGKGAVYNVVLYRQDMNTLADLVYQPDPGHEFEPNDSLVFAWTNTNARTWGMEILYKAGD